MFSFTHLDQEELEKTPLLRMIWKIVKVENIKLIYIELQVSTFIYLSVEKITHLINKDYVTNKHLQWLVIFFPIYSVPDSTMS